MLSHTVLDRLSHTLECFYHTELTHTGKIRLALAEERTSLVECCSVTRTTETVLLNVDSLNGVRVLLLQNLGETQGEMFLPTDSVYEGEAPTKTAIRMLEEDIHIRVRRLQPIDIYDKEKTANTLGKQTGIGFYSILETNEPILLDETTPHASFVNIEEGLMNERLRNDHRNMIAKACAQIIEVNAKTSGQKN